MPRLERQLRCQKTLKFVSVSKWPAQKAIAADSRTPSQDLSRNIDKLSHYLRCNPLWLVACSALKLDNSYASIDFPRRLGFPVPSSTSLIMLCVMFKTYHALRRDFASMITLSVADEDFSDLMHRAFFLASHFAADWI